MSRTTILTNSLCGALWGQSAAVSLRTVLLAGLLAGGALVSPIGAQSAAKAGAASPAPLRYRSDRFVRRADMYYGLVWGVDSLGLKAVESGQIIRFTYRVLDAEKAKQLNDKKAQPILIDQKAGVKLVIPTLERVGQLRQSSTPEAGRSYRMAFSNKGRLVKPGNRVSVVIGKFKADGLVVD